MQNIGFFIGIFVLSKIALGIAALSTNLRDKLLSNRKKAQSFDWAFWNSMAEKGGVEPPIPF
ncbi:hypothetical protein B0D95_01925 [Cellvibrio sp. PSBB023]|nr:hypothetical protein B0D95_01925 [Cellvibrio sp. PSBB023]